MRRTAGATVAVAIVSIAMLVGAGAAGARVHAARSTLGLGALVPTQKNERLPLHGGTADSLNWSGYAVTPSGGGITAVSQKFTVPSAGLVPTTQFGVTSRGTADLGVPGDLRNVTALLVTVEPQGGSVQPTTRPVIQLPLSYVSHSQPT